MAADTEEKPKTIARGKEENKGIVGLRVCVFPKKGGRVRKHRRECEKEKEKERERERENERERE